MNRCKVHESSQYITSRRHNPSISDKGGSVKPLNQTSNGDFTKYCDQGYPSLKRGVPL